MIVLNRTLGGEKGEANVRCMFTVGLLLLGASSAFAQNPYVRAADAIPRIQRVECPQELELLSGTIMIYRGAMAEISRLCYLAPMGPDEFKAEWGVALSGIGAKPPLQWDVIWENPNAYRRHAHTSTLADLIGIVELIENPSGEPLSLVTLSTGEMEVDTVSGRPFRIIGSTRFAVAQALLDEGWDVSADQLVSEGMLSFRSDVDLVIRFDYDDIAMFASFYGSFRDPIPSPRALELIRLAGEGIAMRQEWREDPQGPRLIEIHIGEHR